MLNAVIRFSVRNKLIILLLTIAWIAWGIMELNRLPIDALPDITSNQVQVITVSPTLASPEVERLITFPVEQACFNIPGIREIRSISRFGLSVVTIVFNDNSDVYWARQQVSERMTRIREDIPKNAGIPELAPVTTGLGEIYQYVLKPARGYESKYTLDELRSIQDWIVRRQILGTPGVAEVSSFGGNLKQYEVAIRPDQLKGMGISIQDVFNALEQNNQNSGGAYIEKGPSMLFIRTEGLTGTTEDIGRIFVKTTPGGIPVYIRDIAEVRIGHAVRYGAMTLGSKGEVAGAVVMMLKGENASRVVKNVKDKIEKIRQTLPKGVEMETFYDRTKMVDRAIHTVKKNLLEGALIVVFILVIFLSNLRASLIVASVIPLSMMFAVGMMNYFGVSGNLMSLGALDFGLIVDGAVIIVEAVMHRLYHRHLYNRLITTEELDDAVITSSTRMMNAAVFGQAIILIVYLPILSLTGIEGKMFRPMAQTVSFALIGAFILSLTYVPMVTAFALSRKVREHDTWTDRMLIKLQQGYTAILTRAFSFPKTVVGSALALLVIAVFLASRLGGEFIPKLEEGDFAVDAKMMTGTSLSQSIQTSMKAASILEKFPEVEKIVTRIGASEIPTDPMPVEMTDIMVTLKEKDTWTSASSFDELADKMSRELKTIPGYSTGFQYPVQMRFNELIAGARQDVVCKIFGENLDSLAAYAARLGKLIQGINGAADLYVETVTGLPQIVIRYNYGLMSIHRLNVADVNRVVRTAFAGEAAGKVYENERKFDLVVRLADKSRTDIDDVRQLLVATPGGQQIPLYQVADIKIEEGPNQIQREDAKRRIIVGFNARGRDVQSIVNELQQKAENALILPAGYYIHYGGQFENLVEAKQRLSIAVPIALGLIFVLLYFAFGSVKYGLLIYSAIPLSAIGGVMSLWIRNMPFSISAGVGFIALFGVAVLNGIVLITEFNRLKTDGMEDVKQIILEGTRLRLRPVLMTAAVASLGFMPMALSQGAGAEVQRPLATVVIGGLLTATLLTLIVLPLLYYWLEKPGKIKIPPVAALMIALLVSAAEGFAQPSGRPVSLDTMIAIASRQNLGLQVSIKNNEYWEALRSKTYELPKTQLGAEYGNINSFNYDNRFLISQTLPLPGVSKRHRELYEAQLSSSQAGYRLKKQELNREVRLNYYAMQDNLFRREILQRMDSVYSGFLEAASIRYKTGETGLLEQTAAESQLAQIRLQQEQLMADLRILQEKNRYLLRINEKLLPFTDTSLHHIQAYDSVAGNHPLLEYWEKQALVNEAQIRAEKATLNPDFSLGYSNLSMIGWQSPDGVNQKYYNSGDRFNIFSFGMGIPLARGTVRARMNAGAVSRDMSKMQKMQADEFLQSRLKQYTDEYQKQQAAVRYYRESGLRHADLISSQATLSYRTGNIGYPEWATLVSQATQIQMNYLDALHALRLSEIEIEFIHGN